MNKYKDEQGSVQVIEMSLLLPIIMVFVISIIYLTFFVFTYVYSYVLTEVAISEVSHIISSSNISMRPDDDGSFVEGEKTIGKLSEQLQDICVLPGMHTEVEYDVNTDRIIPRLDMDITFFYFGKRIFTIVARREVYIPQYFAQNVDFIIEVSRDTGFFEFAPEKMERLRELCNEIF